MCVSVKIRDGGEDVAAAAAAAADSEEEDETRIDDASAHSKFAM